MEFARFSSNPIIFPQMEGLEGKIGENINGPSLIRVPEWAESPLGKYYLYFAHHGGEYIRMAYADSLQGPWKIHKPGVLWLKQTSAQNHIASPDVHIDHDTQTMRMYFHGCTPDNKQRTFVAFSSDGLNWKSNADVLAHFYLRAFPYKGEWYGITKEANHGGIIQKSPDGIEPFEEGPRLIYRMRHAALLRDGEQLHIFYSRGEDCPESILYSRMSLKGDWRKWPESLTPPLLVLRPEASYEGVDLPPIASTWGAVHESAHQLRDPALFVEDGTLYMIYSIAGESGLAIAQTPLPTLNTCDVIP